ncbi:UDP-3-O-acylglucosamine N-acyltransferase [[Eubacterium] infirmum]|nr:UDP-3-O-acylglucosamine N-acyltransferase [[Eubacterium] infirmum]
MFLSDVLKNMGIAFEAIDEKPIKSLGLVNYNGGCEVCTFAEKLSFVENLPKSISMLITKRDVAESLKNEPRNYGFIVTEYPRVTFFMLHNTLCNSKKYVREKIPTKIGKSCDISKLACIADNNVIIGDNVTIEEFVSIKENTVIGDNCVIRTGSVIGSTGYEFKRNFDGDKSFLVEHIGGVKIGNNVEIQHNTCVDKAIYPWDDTVISDYCNVDNLVHIAHGVKLGKLSYVVAGAKIGGRCNIGENVWIGLGAIIRNGLTIGSNSRVNMGAVVTKSVADGEAVSGNFAIEHSQFIAEMKKK